MLTEFNFSHCLLLFGLLTRIVLHNLSITYIVLSRKLSYFIIYIPDQDSDYDDDEDEDDDDADDRKDENGIGANVNPERLKAFNVSKLSPPL